jgi:hypothetical protein
MIGKTMRLCLVSIMHEAYCLPRPRNCQPPAFVSRFNAADEQGLKCLAVQFSLQ